MDTKYSISVLKIWADTYMDTCQTKQSDFFYACKNVSYSSRLKKFDIYIVWPKYENAQDSLETIEEIILSNDHHWQKVLMK